MQQEPVLETGICDQGRVVRLCELEPVALNTAAVKTRRPVFRLECVGQSGHGLAIRVLEEPSLPSLDLDDAAQVARVDQELLVL